MIEAVTKNELAEKGCMQIERVNDGFENYHSMIISGSSAGILDFLVRAMNANVSMSYADFYYFMLKPEEQQRFCNSLTADQLALLAAFRPAADAIYYQLTPETIAFFADITARELLFSTFYFNHKKAVVWGNYGLSYPVFCENAETLEEYKRLAASCGLDTGGNTWNEKKEV